MPLDLQTRPGVDTPATGQFHTRNKGPCIRVRRWAVLETYPQAEHWASQNLQQRGYHPFVPQRLTTSRDAATPTMTRAVLRPLFSGYIFVQHDPADPWHPIRYCPGIKAHLLGGKGIQYALDADVSVLQATEALRTSESVQSPSGVPCRAGKWAPGLPCSLRKGHVMELLPAVVLTVRGKHAAIAMMFLGQLRHMSVPLSALNPPGDT